MTVNSTQTNVVPTTFALGGKLEVNRIGYGAMRLTGQPGNFGPYSDWQGGVSLVKRAADLGINFFDSARSYGPESADQLLGEALMGKDVVIATKGGVDKPEPGKISVDGSARTLHREIEQARKNLRCDRIDLFQLHRVDPETPIETSVEALYHARERGLIGHIGLSNITLEQFHRAMQVAPIASVQNRFNLGEQAEMEMVRATAKQGVAFIPYGPLGANPMKPGAKLSPKEALVWLLKQSPNIIVIPGTTSIAHLEENWRTWSNL